MGYWSGVICTEVGKIRKQNTKGEKSKITDYILKAYKPNHLSKMTHTYVYLGVFVHKEVHEKMNTKIIMMINSGAGMPGEFLVSL
jgi:hypothetical protein